MAITYSNLSYSFIGDRWRVTGLLALTAGDEVLSPGDIGLDTIEQFRAQPSSGYVFEFAPATLTLTPMYGNYDDTGDSVLIADATASPSNVPFEAIGF